MRNFKLPSKKEMNFALNSFSKNEWIVFIGLLTVLLLSTISILGSINKSFLVQVPLREGSISLGLVGVPRFVNPVLANSETDTSLVSFIYSGLLRKSEDGKLILDLAEKYENSENGLIYTFTLKDNLYFQDGKPLTANDVLFTINAVKDSVIKSPLKINWDGVNIEKIDEKTIRFTLKQSYASFLENTTLGIMPAHIWDNSPVELNNANTNPIGSGPYMISSTNKESSGIIDYYKLVPFKKFVLNKPYIKNINLHFYQNETDLVQALIDKKVENISSITPLNAKILKEKNYQVESSALPRVFGLFFNQNQNQLFIDKNIIRAIDQTIDKEKIIKEILLGYGNVIDGPIPSNIAGYQKSTEETDILRQDLLQKVQNDLSKNGWKTGPDGFLEKTTTEKKKKVTTKLEFSISTGNVEELVKTAELIKQDLEAVGIKVEVKTFETGNLNQNVIRPRKYDALLFGEIVNREPDLFAFWHSSQRKDPGLNIAMYTNTKVDKILEEASTLVEEKPRIEKYLQFSEEIKKDMPAVFLYSPDFIYIVSKNLQGSKTNHIISPSDRYLNVYLWYTQTENVWKVFY
ncbi:MAG: Extracellular solute-binding protein family 5 [Parcubacteria group bacterium GW2011_GWB1_36_5]|nr:MAG: Extracellular solute-binding protein family 5 [Parcubacteria group bacterium GW2011_GWB1_36_5]